MAQTFIPKGNVITNPSQNNINSARFVRVTATADTTGELLDSSNTKLAEFYLENGNTVIIEKDADQKITCATSKASSVGSPRS
tara:strand:- start:3217 stop:3465 length:249 start_codon:yes stop_codon:yes gene_type:complete